MHATSTQLPSVEQHDDAGVPVVSVRGLTKVFRSRRTGNEPVYALRDVDIDVHPGEFLVLLGPSGCGKTTLLRSIAGLEQPTKGSITIDGAPVFDQAKKLNTEPENRPVGMIFQSYALWPHMTALKNTAFPLRCRRVARAEADERAKDILTRVGIGHLTSRYPSEMSGGQQQRLALARALVVGQRVVLFDEPLSNVDAQVREKLRLELVRMQRDLGFTAIYVTHDQSEAMELADRIAVMDHGRVAQLGAPQDMFERPSSVHVARFLGQSNEMPFTVETVDREAGTVSGTSPVGRLTAVLSEEGGLPVEPGSTFAAFGRPGDFEITKATGTKRSSPIGTDGVNVWNGTVESVRFLGTHVQVVVQAGDLRLRCWGVPAGTEVTDGDAVQVRVPVRALRMVSDSSPQPEQA